MSIFASLAGGLAGKLLVGLLATAVAAGAGYWRGVHVTRGEQAQANLKASEAARLKEQAQGRRQSEITNALQRQNDRIAADLDAAVRELRVTRRDRLPEASRAACQGATGRELSGRDAEDLERLAARAERQRKRLEVCYADEDSVR